MERSRAFLWLLVLTVPVLAGCVGDDPAPAQSLRAVAIDELTVGVPYLFEHDGGDLRFSISEGDAVVTLFDPDDLRVGQIQLGKDYFRQSLRIDAAKAGGYVLVPDAIENATLQVRSGEALVDRFFPLGSHFERHVLFQNGLSSDPLSGLIYIPPMTSEGDVVGATTNLTLQRVPVQMQLLLAGSANELEVEVRSDRGMVFRSESSFNSPGTRLDPLGGQFEPRNVRDGVMTATVHAQDFQGVVVLESWSYSRFQPDIRPASIATEDVEFTYGELPGRPALLRVHDLADALYLWTSAANGSKDPDTADPTAETSGNGTEATEAFVALYGPDDDKIGTYRLTPGVTLRIPVDSGGEYVAVLKQGVAYIGADRVPVDFEVRVLDVVQEDFPPEPAGTAEEYAIVLGNSSTNGVPFALRPMLIEGGDGDLEDQIMPPLTGCTDEGTIRFLQDGETLGFWGSTVPNELADVDLYLGTGQVTFVQDGLGGTCGHSGFTLSSYVR